MTEFADGDESKVVSFKRGIYKDFRPKPMRPEGGDAPKDSNVPASASSSGSDTKERERGTSPQGKSESSASAARAPLKGGPSMPRS